MTRAMAASCGDTSLGQIGFAVINPLNNATGFKRSPVTARLDIMIIVNQNADTGGTMIAGPVLADRATIGGNGGFVVPNNPPSGTPTDITTQASWVVQPGAWKEQKSEQAPGAPNLPLQMNVVFRNLRRDDGQGLIELIVALTILAIGIEHHRPHGKLSLVAALGQEGDGADARRDAARYYRNLAYPDVRLDDGAWKTSPLTNGSDPYFTAHSSDSTIPSGAKAGEVIDTGTGINACVATPPECEPVRTDHRSGSPPL